MERNDYQLVGMLLQPYGNYDNDIDAIRDWEKMQEDDNFAFEQLLNKYQVESDNIESFECIADYLIDDDADGIYLFKKVVK